MNDGIDLLIEAIKNAPDIKPIKKKVLQSLPINIRTTRTTEPPFNISKEDSSSDSNKISKENNETSESRHETLEQSGYPNRDEDQPSKNVYEDTNTEAVYYRRDLVTSEGQMFETTILPGAYTTSQVEYATEHNNFEKLENAINEDTKKIEVYVGDVEDDDVNVDITSTTTPAPVDEETEAATVSVPVETTEFKLPEIKKKQSNVVISDSSGSSDGEKRVTLDWLEDGEDQESKEIKPANKTTSIQADTQTATIKSTLTTKEARVDNISSLTREAMDEESRRKKSKIDVEDVMFKKQMDLLNSLDYGTERSETNDSESKDGDERYSDDAFPSFY